MTTPGPQHLPTEWVPRLASLVAAIRADWDEQGIRATLAKVADRPLAAVTLAAITAAITRTDQHTPVIIAMPGAHWTIRDGQISTEPTQSLILTRCEHGQISGDWCADCARAEVHTRVMPTPEQRAQMRADIRAGREALAADIRPATKPEEEA